MKRTLSISYVGFVNVQAQERKQARQGSNPLYIKVQSVSIKFDAKLTLRKVDFMRSRKRKLTNEASSQT